MNSAIGGGFQRHVRQCERREPVTRLQGPLAADRIRRVQLGPQCGIGDLAGQVFAGHIRQALRHLGVGAEVGGFVGLERRIADLEGLAGIAFEELLLLGGERLVDRGADPDRGALEHRQVRGLRRDLGYVLDGAGTGADRSDPFACSRFRVVPRRRVKRAAPNRSAPGISGMLGTSSIPTALTTASNSYVAPSSVGSDQRRASSAQRILGDAGVAEQMVRQAVVGRHPLEIGQDLRLLGERLAPPRVERERVRVEVRRHVAGGARVGVVAPGAAEAVGPVEDGEVVAAAAS